MYIKRLIGTNILAKKDTDKVIDEAERAWYKKLVYKMGSQFLIDYKFPLHLYLELSRACNYNCKMCMRSESPKGSHFPEELAKKIVAEAAKKGPTSYSLHLFGEPLVNPKWDRIVETVRTGHNKNAILLTTNGYLLDSECSKRLIDLKVNRIFVSFHSLDPERYREKTGGGDVEVVLDNVKEFAKLTKGSETKLFVRLFLDSDEEDICAELIDELRGDGLFIEQRNYHNFAGGKPEWSSYIEVSSRWPCFHPWFTLGVAIDGTATVCCADAKLGLNVGNANNQSIEQIWNSDEVRSIRSEHLKGKFDKWKTCEHCDTWKFHPNIF